MFSDQVLKNCAARVNRCRGQKLSRPPKKAAQARQPSGRPAKNTHGRAVPVAPNLPSWIGKSGPQQQSSLGEIGKHDRLKICSLWVIGSIPIVSTQQFSRCFGILAHQCLAPDMARGGRTLDLAAVSETPLATRALARRASTNQPFIRRAAMPEIKISAEILKSGSTCRAVRITINEPDQYAAASPGPTQTY